VGIELTERDPELVERLRDAKVVAVVGLSSKPWRASHDVATYLQEHGYRVVPVNPGETEVLGEPAYPSLLDIPDDVRIDIVDVFRRAEHTPGVAEHAVRIGAGLLWLQEDIVSEEAARIATDGGVDVIMGVCIRQVRERLMGQEGT
jgi:predicted CoA-binding protein